jgi:hypothetical protein
MARRRFLAQMAAWPLAALVPITTFPEHRSASLKIVLKSAWGSDDPTKAAFPFSHAHAFAGGVGRPRHHRVARPTHGDERKRPRMTGHGPSPETLTEDLGPPQHRRRYAMGHA